MDTIESPPIASDSGVGRVSASTSTFVHGAESLDPVLPTVPLLEHRNGQEASVHVLVINYGETRKGNVNDVEALEWLFSSRRNCRVKSVSPCARDLRDGTTLCEASIKAMFGESEPTVFILFVLSHGTYDGFIEAEKNEQTGRPERFNVRDLFDALKNNDFLKSALKLLMLGTCRGEKEEQQAKEDDAKDFRRRASGAPAPDATQMLPEPGEENFIVFYATVDFEDCYTLGGGWNPVRRALIFYDLKTDDNKLKSLIANYKNRLGEMGFRVNILDLQNIEATLKNVSQCGMPKPEGWLLVFVFAPLVQVDYTPEERFEAPKPCGEIPTMLLRVNGVKLPDGGTVKMGALTFPFTGDKCSTYAGKPKIILVLDQNFIKSDVSPQKMDTMRQVNSCSGFCVFTSNDEEFIEQLPTQLLGMVKGKKSLQQILTQHLTQQGTHPKGRLWSTCPMPILIKNTEKKPLQYKYRLNDKDASLVEVINFFRSTHPANLYLENVTDKAFDELFATLVLHMPDHLVLLKSTSSSVSTAKHLLLTKTGGAVELRVHCTPKAIQCPQCKDVPPEVGAINVECTRCTKRIHLQCTGELEEDGKLVKGFTTSSWICQSCSNNPAN